MTPMEKAYAARIEAGHLKRDPAQEAVLPELERIRKALAQPVRRGLFRKAPEPPKGLYMWGGVGRGKSMLMDLFVDLVEAPARRVHFHAFMQEIHRKMHDARKQGRKDALEPAAKSVSDSVRLLAFDEMQVTDITDAMIVGRLFEALFNAGVVVVSTSNRPPDDLYKDGLNRNLFLPFIDLIKTRMVVWELTSPRDYRQDRRSGGQVYFTPLGREARKALDEVWDDLAGQPGEPLDLTVNGRTVTLPEHHDGVARVRFMALCGQALGPADFLAIADAVRVLIIDDIPQLGGMNYNEAKRFVTLIDALYEAKVRLFASAAARPEMLCIEGPAGFEFERTASRLREMQSESWGR